MKVILTATLFLFCVASAYAQAAEPQTKQFKPIRKSNLYLNYMGKDSSVLGRIKGNDVTSRHLMKREAVKTNQAPMEQLKPNMPILKPDSSTQFHILAMEPDSSTLYHIQTKKPEVKGLPR